MATLFTESGIKDMLSADEFNAGLQKISEAANLASEGKISEAVDPKMVDSITQALKVGLVSKSNRNSDRIGDEFNYFVPSIGSQRRFG